MLAGCAYSPCIPRVLNAARVLREVLTLVKAGYVVELIAVRGTPLQPEAGVDLYLFEPAQRRIRQRLVLTWRIGARAVRYSRDMFHFHDPDLLPVGVLLRLLGRQVVYDVHEHYRMKWPTKVKNRALQWLLGRVIAVVEDACAGFIGNVSVVASSMIPSFARRGCRVIVTPNYASLEQFALRRKSLALWPGRLRRVIYVGGLDEGRGTRVLFEIARQCRHVRPDIQFVAIRRYLSSLNASSWRASRLRNSTRT